MKHETSNTRMVKSGMQKTKEIRLMSIAGARPNFMKLASIVRAVQSYNEYACSSDIAAIHHIIVHTGQHYDQKMSHGFFDDLGIPRPDVNLEVGSGSHAVQTAEIMKRFEQVLLREQPDVLLVVGDVNSTIACMLVAAKIEYPLGGKRARPLLVHVEAGLRSFDRNMPEEINRLLTDAISDVLFVTEQSGLNNLLGEGVPKEKIHFVGNVMIDTLMQHLSKARLSSIKQELAVPAKYGLVTLHRPSNVDNEAMLSSLVNCLLEIAVAVPLIFPVHPRTLNRLDQFGLLGKLRDHKGIQVVEPLGYLDFLNLTETAMLVITDSGGIQEETTYLGVPCVTLRANTERPVTVTEGTNYLIGTEPARIIETAMGIIGGKGKKSAMPRYWDGKAGDRIIEVLSSMPSLAV